MYHRNIDIVIASRSAELASIIATVPMPEGFLLSLSSTDALEPTEVPACDLLIHDLNTPASAMVQHLCNHAALVLCLEATQPLPLPLSVRNELADIWLKPFTAETIQFRFQKLIQHLILKRKFSLSQTYLDTMINSVPDLIWFKRLDGIHVKVNDEFCSTVGKKRPDIEGFDHYHIWDIPKEVYENSDYVCLDTDSVVIGSKQSGVFDETVAAPQGFRQLKTYKSPIFDEDGDLIGTVGVAQDVTELKNTDAKLELILRTMPFAVMITDCNQQVLSVNQKFEEYFQISQDTVLGHPFFVREAFAANPAHPPNLLYYEPDKEIGLSNMQEELILEIHKEPIYDSFNNWVGTLHIFRDVTMERGFQSQLKQLAYTDQLTGLSTRRYLYEHIDGQVNAANLNLLYIDLDNFKLINDTFGHHYGDKVLKKIGSILQQNFPDDVCVRMGGDEFLIAIVGKRGIDWLTQRANHLIQTFKDHFPGSSALQPLSVSIGIATVVGDVPVQLDDLLRKSDIALYKAKNSGKKQCVVYTLDLENKSDNHS